MSDNLYKRQLRNIDLARGWIDYYAIDELYEMDSITSHAVKKLLIAGSRSGGKSEKQDLIEARNQLNRAIDDIELSEELTKDVPVPEHCDEMETTEVPQEKTKHETMEFKMPAKTAVKSKGFININGYEVPEPVRAPLEAGDRYYYFDSAERGYLHRSTWTKHPQDTRLLAAGLIHKTKEAAETHVKALLSFTKIEEGES